MVAARIERRPTGALETAAARMFAAVAAFQLVYHLPALVPGFMGLLIGALTGLLVYALVVWAFFRLTRLELGVVVSGHVLLLIAMMLGTHLTHLYRSALEGLVGATP
jgi:high-affinity Fe2+/Pb2+ permease